MKMFIAVLLAVVGNVVAVIDCPRDICKITRCNDIPERACDGRVAPNAGFCGCCAGCVKQVGKGARCLSSSLLLGQPSTVECVNGLFCNTTSRVCEKKTCGMELADAKASNILGLQVPRCEKDGTYKAVQCTGSVCYCVNKTGNVLFADKANNVRYSDNIGQQASMNCRCARDLNEYMTTNGAPGPMFMCEKNGNYKKVACTGSVCYCADEFGKQVGTSTVNIGKLGSLNC